jgi:hypothetical protein
MLASVLQSRLRGVRTMSDDEVTVVVRALVSYLRTHPLACDSALGIAHWWLEPEDVVSMDVLVQALEWLKSQGALEESTGADGRVRYRRRGDDGLLDRIVAARTPWVRGDDS